MYYLIVTIIIVLHYNRKPLVKPSTSTVDLLVFSAGAYKGCYGMYSKSCTSHDTIGKCIAQFFQLNYYKF